MYCQGGCHNPREAATTLAPSSHLKHARLSPSPQEVDGCHKMVCQMRLDLKPSRLSFCAAGSNAVVPNRRRKVTSELTRPLMHLVAGSVGGSGDGSEGGPQRQESRVMELFKGMSSELPLPGGIDLIMHEILGNIASAEGAILAINELLDRDGLPSATCRVVPAAAGTMLAPTGALEPCVVERLLMYERTGEWSARPGRLYASRGFPHDKMLSAPQPMEWLEFNRRLPHKSVRTCRFRTHRAGFFDGLHMHLQIDLDEDTTIDTYRERTTWTCTYVRLFGTADAIWLPPNSLIECTCTVDASTHCPAYSIAVRISRDGHTPTYHVAEFSWRGDG